MQVNPSLENSNSAAYVLEADSYESCILYEHSHDSTFTYADPEVNMVYRGCTKRILSGKPAIDTETQKCGLGIADVNESPEAILVRYDRSLCYSTELVKEVVSRTVTAIDDRLRSLDF